MSLPQTNPYQENNNIRPVCGTGLTERAQMREIGWRGGGEALTVIQPPKSYLGIEFSTEETQNHQWGGLGTEPRLWKREERSEEQIRRERVTGQF
jgi:hypothetical protein